MKRLAVITVNYGTPRLTMACLESLELARSSFEDLTLVIVDGGSTDDSVEIIGQNIRDGVELLPLAVNGGFAFANNRAMMMLASRGELPDYIALINPDTRVTPGALEVLAEALDRELGAGAVGALLIHDDGRPQASAFHFPTLLGEFCRGARTGAISRLFRHESATIEATKACQVPWVTGAAVMFRTSALQSTGLFDEGFFLYFEETELMWRMSKAGWQIWHEPAAKVFHAGGAATKIRDPETGRALPKRIPRYWYESRRRYFALVGGPLFAFAAGLAWLGGHGFWKLRCFIFRKPADGPFYQGRDLAAFGLWPARDVETAVAPEFSSLAAPLPFWTQLKT